MSLINQMLKDLQERQTSESSQAPLGGLEAPISSNPPRGKRLKWLMLLLIALGCWGSGYLWGHFKVETPEQHHAVVKQPKRQMEPVARQPKLEVVVSRPKIASSSTPAQESVVVSSKDTTPKPAPLKRPQQSPEKKEQQTKPAVPENTQVKAKKSAKVAVVEPRVSATKVANASQQPQAVPLSSSLEKSAPQLTPAQNVKKAQKLVRQRNLEAAVPLLEKVLAEKPDHKAARELLVEIFFSTGQFQRAEAVLKEGIEQSNAPSTYIVQLARLQIEQGRAAAAEATLGKLANPSPIKTPDWFALSAHLCQQQGRYAEAANHYETLTRETPQARWWLGLALAQEGLGKGGQAVTAYKAVVRSKDGTPRMRGFAQQRLQVLTQQ